MPNWSELAPLPQSPAGHVRSRPRLPGNRLQAPAERLDTRPGRASRYRDRARPGLGLWICASWMARPAFPGPPHASGGGGARRLGSTTSPATLPQAGQQVTAMTMPPSMQTMPGWLTLQYGRITYTRGTARGWLTGPTEGWPLNPPLRSQRWQPKAIGREQMQKCFDLVFRRKLHNRCCGASAVGYVDSSHWGC